MSTEQRAALSTEGQDGSAGSRSWSPERIGRTGVRAPLAVLVVEDEAPQAELVGFWLAEAGVAHQRVVCHRLSDALDHLAANEVDVALVDLNLPDARGVQAVRALREAHPTLPMVVLTGMDAEALAHEALALGAQDYLRKDLAGPEALRLALTLAIARAEIAEVRTAALTVDRLRTLGRLAAGVAQEINNPLQVVHSAVDLGRTLLDEPEGREWRGSDTLRDALDDARIGMLQVGRVVQAMAAMAWAEEGEQERLEVGELIAEACQIARTETRWVGVDVVHGSALFVWGIRERLLQALVNLILNAVDALGRAERTERVSIETLRRGGTCQIQVTDQAGGIDPGEVDQLFEPSYRTAAGRGTGLGLPVCRAIALEHGGDVSVDSQPGLWTTFTLSLPLATAHFARTSDSAPGEGRKRVLIVDDEPLILHGLARSLAHCDTVTALGAARAIARLNQDDGFDALLLDVNMPGTGGRELYGLIRKRWPHLADRTIFLTGGLLTDKDRAFYRGRAVLRKPVDVTELQVWLDQLS